MHAISAADGGFGLLWIGVAGFVIGLILAKMKVVTESNLARFATWTSCAVAAIAALAADTPAASGLSSLFGRLGIFAIVSFVFGLIFTLGLALGLEKTDKANGKDR